MQKSLSMETKFVHNKGKAPGKGESGGHARQCSGGVEGARLPISSQSRWGRMAGRQ